MELQDTLQSNITKMVPNMTTAVVDPLKTYHHSLSKTLHHHVLLQMKPIPVPNVH